MRKLNKMYFKRFYKERATVFSVIVLLTLILLDFFSQNTDEDFIKWQLRTVVIIVLFLIFRYSIVNIICRIIFQLTIKLIKNTDILGKYRFNFTNSCIYVQSPLGAFNHKWEQIEKAILTKDFFFLYVNDKDEHIISISNKYNKDRDINELISFVESNVTGITKM
ncbi:hypothetical protein AB9T88_15750 [Flavobacterium sp. LBUM151]